jgi:hypothetical protein
VAYEKISNFVINNSDIDTCNIDQLYSWSRAVNENTNDYKLTYPSSTKRLMDILSINQSRLWGSPSINQNNFIEPSIDGIFNRGEPLSSSTYYVTAGIPVILKTKSLNKYELVYTGFINELSTYPLHLLVNYLNLNTNDIGAWQGYYEFFEFIPDIGNVQIDGIVDWNNKQTTINQALSSNYNWVANEKTIDRLFSYDLYKGLGVFPVGLA